MALFFWIVRCGVGWSLGTGIGLVECFRTMVKFLELPILRSAYRENISKYDVYRPHAPQMVICDVIKREFNV